MFKFQKAVILFVVLFLGGCVSSMVQPSGGDPNVRAKGETMPMGVTYSQVSPLPPATQYPIKISNWTSLSKEVRDVLKDYVHDRGDYLPATLRFSMPKSNGGGVKTAFGGGNLYLENSTGKSYTLMVTDWREKSAILLELEANGISGYFEKHALGVTGDTMAYVNTAMANADKEAIVDLLNKMQANKDKINSCYKSYIKSNYSY